MSQNHTGTFADLGIASNLYQVLAKKGFEIPTPIQHQVIPGALQGNDIIGIAQTGTGKTLAFAVPMIQSLSRTKGKGLVIVPTRELAEQVDEEFRNIGASFGLRTALLIGGNNEQRQIKAMKKDPHIIVATPGRLMDFVDRKIVRLTDITAVTLDEADRMLDMGFLPSIKQVMSQVPDSRQTMLFSATLPQSIGKLANDFMKTPLRIEVAPQGTAAKNVAQELYIVPQKQKMSLLEHVLKENPRETVLIFSRTKHGAKRIKQKLERTGESVTEIHGNRSQAQRKRALDGFAKKRYRIMVATDVAARGIDVDHLTLVINYDIPDNSIEDYVHRIGRTGRAGRSGRALTFATPGQKRDVRAIERLINASLTVLNLPTLAADTSSADDEREPREHQSRPQRNRGQQRSRPSNGRSPRGRSRRGGQSRPPKRGRQRQRRRSS